MDSRIALSHAFCALAYAISDTSDAGNGAAEAVFKHLPKLASAARHMHEIAIAILAVPSV
ncbi:hypothetical protein [Calothrix sp. NIES-2100]|uniref:hypothetical protein n=1 Tax=Calothrix sp. NIES-2100 TaxID=1954172 RepID=UPI0030D94DEB